MVVKDVHIQPDQPAIYGREGELERLRTSLATAVAGQGQLALVAGEAGVGKTTLVEALGREAAAVGALVLTGGCYDLMTTAPYAPWIELLRGLNGVRERDVPPLLADLDRAAMLPGKDALFQDIAEFVADLAAQQPLVLVLEDLHWADDASLDLLRELARRLRRARVLLIATHRDELAADDALFGVLPLLIREARAERVTLRRLTLDAVRQMVVERYSLPATSQRELTTWLHSLSDGNPFFISELLQTLEYESVMQRSPDGWTLGDLAAVRVPLLVQHVIDGRLRWLSDDGRRLLQIAAVIGNEVPLSLWRAVATAGDDALAVAIEQAQSARLVVELADGSGWRFTHALIREVLYHGLTLPRRQSWHRSIAEALSARPGADPDLVAHHFQRADDPRAAEWLIQAGDRATRSFAYVAAATRYEQALAILNREGRAPHERVHLQCDLAYAYRFADPQRGLRHLDDAEALLLGNEDDELVVWVRWGRVWILGVIGKPSLEPLRDAVAAYAGLTDEQRQRIAASQQPNAPSFGRLAMSCARHGDYDEAIRLAERQLADQATASSPADEGSALCALGMAWAALGAFEKARESFASGRELARRIRDHYLLGTLLNWEMMELVLPYSADDPQSRRRLADDAAIAWGRVGLAGEETPRDMTVYALLLLDGRWQEADESAHVDIEIESMRFDGLRLLAELEQRRGHADRSRGYLLAALPDGPATEPSNFYFYSTLWLQRLGARLALDAGDMERARAWIEAHDRWLAWSGRLLDRPSGSLLWSRYHLVDGDAETAVRLATDALEQATTPRQPLALLESHRLLGELLARSGERERAREHLDAASAIAEAADAPYELALTLAAGAELDHAAGHVDRLRADLAEVRRLSVMLAAQPLLDRVARLDTPLPAETPVGVLPLSSREVEVLRLVATGLSNAEVGERLFISPRTVAQHLQSIYNKLGISSRTAAAAIAFEHGLVDARDAS